MRNPDLDATEREAQHLGPLCDHFGRIPGVDKGQVGTVEDLVWAIKRILTRQHVNCDGGNGQ